MVEADAHGGVAADEIVARSKREFAGVLRQEPGTNRLTLGKGLTPASIETDGAGTGRADLWRDLAAFAPGLAFDIHFRVVEDATAHVALETGCHRFVIRD